MCLADSYHDSPDDWAQQHFGDTDLGDVRRTRRVVTLAAAVAAKPGSSIPRLFQHRYDVKAAYHLLSLQDLSPDVLQATHRRLVREHLQHPGVFLLVEDATVLSWSGNQPISGLGTVGPTKHGGQGFTLQTVLALQWPSVDAGQGHRPVVSVLGIPSQNALVRHPDPAQRGTPEHPTESQLWTASNQALGPAPPQAEWVRVCDRGADIYEFLRSCQDLGHHFVVRASKNRVVSDPETGEDAGYLFPCVRSQATLGTFTLDLRGRQGQAARTAHLNVSLSQVVLRSPQRPGGRAGSLPPIRCQVVRVWEPDPPAKTQALEWILLCDRDIPDLAAALACVRMYTSRWVIEEFHKALKTGVGAEKLQLETAARLEAAVAIWSVVALRLIALRELARVEPEAPAAASGLSELELNVLSAELQRPLKTVRDVALALGRLGGHMNRKSDGLPGWQTLLYGMEELRLITHGVQLAMRLQGTFGV